MIFAFVRGFMTFSSLIAPYWNVNVVKKEFLSEKDYGLIAPYWNVNKNVRDNNYTHLEV